MEDKARCCQNCKAPCAGDFKKVVDLQYSGLVIYLHTKKDEQKKADASKVDDAYILHNTGDKQINRPNYISELRRFKPTCGQCKTIVQRVRSLLDEIRAIKGNEIIGVCDHCKRANINKTCKRCDFIVSKFVSLHRKIREEKQERFKVWLCKVKHLLQAIVQGESVCQHRVYKDTELLRFLHQLKAPLSMREPDIDFFPSLDTEQLSSLQSLSESKEMLEELLSKIKFQGQLSSEDSLYPSPSNETCLCKLLKERQLEESSGFGTEKSRITKDTELPSSQYKDFSRLLSEEVYKELIKRLIDLSKALPKGLHLNRNLIQQLIQTLNIAINQGLTTDIIVKLIKELSELNKTLGPHFSDDLNKDVIQGLINDLNELLTFGTSKDLNQDLIQLLIDLCELLTNELSKGMTKEQSQMFSRSIHKDIARVLSKSAHKDILEKKSERTIGSPKSTEIKQGIPKSGSRDERHGSPKTPTSSKDRSRDVKQSSPKDQRRDVTQRLPKDPSKDVKQESLKDQSKDVRGKSPKSQSKDVRGRSPKSESKDGTQGLPKDIIKDKKLTSPKTEVRDTLKKESKAVAKASPKEHHKEKPPDLSKGKEAKHVSPRSVSKETAPSLSKKEKPQPLSKDNVNKVHKDTKPVSSTIKSKESAQTSSKDVNNELVKKIGNLHKALAGKSLNKEVVQDLAGDINKTLAQKSPDLTKKIIHELTDLCKPAVKGIPKTVNKETVDGLLKEANAAVAKGISNDQNKKSVQGLLSDLNKMINQSKKERQQQSKGMKKEMSKDLSSGLSSKALAPGSQDSSKRRREDQGPSYDVDTTKRKKRMSSRHQDKYGDSMDKSWSEEDIDKIETKPGKKDSKKTKSLQSETKGKTNEKENILPGDDKKKKENSKTMLKSTSNRALKPKQLSQSVLLKMLKENKEKAERYKIFQQRQQTKQKEMDRRRLRELALKGLKPMGKKDAPPPTPETMSESILECNIEQAEPPKLMVAGNTIAPYKPYKGEFEQPMKPLLFNTILEFADDPMSERKVKQRRSIDYEERFRDGTLRYQLSDKEFINKGMTMLPTKKIMRRWNIYRMEPAKPHSDWFERHKKDGELFYDSGIKLADIDNDGRGHWYYQNGFVALDYYNAQETNIGKRYVVYSSGEETENGKLKPRTVLALFDILGNGIVYDHYGNVRLKYNQSEGLLVDPKLGPPGKWKWHTLNDPPVLQQVFVNTRLKERDHKLEQVKKPEKTQDAGDVVKKSHPEMLAIEFENFVKEKTTKLLQKFKPFQIRMKAIKLNEQFSLKILDQANIYLLFREGSTTLKLNLGLLLISSEIIDTDTSEIADVATPYDRHPPKSLSVENIQKILKTVRSGKLCPPSEMNVKFSI